MEVTVCCLDGQGMIVDVTVEVPDDATAEEVQEAAEKKLNYE